MMERAEENKKIEAKTLYNKYYWPYNTRRTQTWTETHYTS